MDAAEHHLNMKEPTENTNRHENLSDTQYNNNSDDVMCGCVVVNADRNVTESIERVANQLLMHQR